MIKVFYFFFLCLLTPMTVHAYIGPGLGAGTIAAVLGILTSIFLAFVAIIWYPLKQLFRKIFNKEHKEEK